MKKQRIFRLCILFGFILNLSFLTSCSDDDIDQSTYAKVYFFWHRSAFDTFGHERYVLSNYSSSHFNGKVNYKITQKTVDETSKLMAPSPIKINGKTTYFNQCGTYDIEINVRGMVHKLSDFSYQGEQTIMLARGNGWAMFISRENWR